MNPDRQLGLFDSLERLDSSDAPESPEANRVDQARITARVSAETSAPERTQATGDPSRSDGVSGPCAVPADRRAHAPETAASTLANAPASDRLRSRDAPPPAAIRAEIARELDRLLGIVRARVSRHVARRWFARPPPVRWFRGRLDAGRALLDAGVIELNADLLETSTRAMIDDTLPHELAHLVVARTCRRRVRPHGPEWQSVMQDWFGVTPERTHRLDVSGIEVRRQRLWTYRCGCTTHELTTVRHRRARAGVAYRCRRCNGALVAATPESAVADGAVRGRAVAHDDACQDA